MKPIATTRYATGIPTSRLAIWWILASEVVIFGGLIAAYLMFRLGHPEWAEASAVTNMWIGAFNTFVLLSSSFTAVLAHQAAEQGDGPKAARLLSFTILGALIFLGVKSFEWYSEISHGYTITAECGGNGTTLTDTSSTTTSVSCLNSAKVLGGDRSTASVDLGTHSLTALADAKSVSYGSAYINETVTIQGAWTGQTRVELTLFLTGGFSGVGSTQQAASGSLSVASGPQGVASYYYDGTNYTLTPSGLNNNGSFAVTDYSSAASDIQTAVTVAFDVDSSSPSFNLMANLVAWAWGDGSNSMRSDFSNTGRIFVDLASGLSAMTDSGFLIPLADNGPPTGSIPEPAALLLMAAPLLWLARRVHHR